MRYILQTPSVYLTTTAETVIQTYFLSKRVIISSASSFKKHYSITPLSRYSGRALFPYMSCAEPLSLSRPGPKIFNSMDAESTKVQPTEVQPTENQPTEIEPSAYAQWVSVDITNSFKNGPVSIKNAEHSWYVSNQPLKPSSFHKFLLSSQGEILRMAQ